MTQVLLFFILCSKLFPPLCPPWGPAALPRRRALSLSAWAGHLPSHPSSGSSSEVKVSRLSPEPRRPRDYISRYKQAGRSRAGSPWGRGWSSTLPTRVCFIPSFQLASAFCSSASSLSGSSASGPGQQQGGWGRVGCEWGGWGAPRTQRKNLELLVRLLASDPDRAQEGTLPPRFLPAERSDENQPEHWTAHLAK